MKQKTPRQRMSIYFPLPLLEEVRKSAEQHMRSFNQEVLWLVQQCLERTRKEQSDENI